MSTVIAMSREEEAIVEAQKLGVGPVTPETMSETIRSMRHFIVNSRMAIDETARIAIEANKLSKKALDRIDDLTGVPGMDRLDGGGVIGRLQSSMNNVEQKVNRGVLWVQWGVGTLIAIAVIAATIYAARPH